ncbi:hormone-sensitive lipase-like isoform X2 [Dysidea avara]|uniref:hormone-sensitive lipase-like isoform X2 n=1 Tax=Dysidea avara TaxID=196820 RepID=UPI00331B5B44
MATVGSTAEVYNFDFATTYQTLEALLDRGIQYYSDRHGDVGPKFLTVFKRGKKILEQAQPHEKYLSSVAEVFDFVYPDGERVKGNGFRSLLYVYHSALRNLLYEARQWDRRHGGWFFVATEYLDNLRANVRVLNGVKLMLEYAEKLAKERVSEGTVFSDGEIATVLKRLAISDDVERDCFYGRCLGFQYTSSYLRPVLQALAVGMASYDSWYELPPKTGVILKMVSSALNGTDYLMFPNRRGMKFADLTQDCDVQFTKAFWSINEHHTIRSLVNIVSPATAIRDEIVIPADDINVEAPTHCSSTFTLKPPSSGHHGVHSIHCLYLSHTARIGHKKHVSKKLIKPAARGLLIHLHGGGFVAQSSLSHEFYLRSWARDLDIPILSIDYSLAPEAPFPRGIDDCVFAYTWALHHFEQLGTTGERIVVTGDSAGGNMLLTMTLKLMELGIRLPDLLVPIYPTTLVKTEISPSRLLSVMDPVLPIGVLISCLNAYTDNVPSKKDFEKRKTVRNDIKLARGKVPFSEYTKRRHTISGGSGRPKFHSDFDPSLSPPSTTDTSAGASNVTSGITSSGEHHCDKVEGLISQVMNTFDDHPTSCDMLVSPLLAPDDILRELPPVSVVVAGLDPLMDDGIEFAKRLIKLGKPVTLDVVPHLPHGFLCLVRHPDTKDTIHTVLSRIKHGLEIPSSCNGTSEHADDSTNEPTDVSTNKSADVSTNEPTDVSTNKSADVSTNEPTDVSTNKSADVSTKATNDPNTKSATVKTFKSTVI